MAAELELRLSLEVGIVAAALAVALDPKAAIGYQYKTLVVLEQEPGLAAVVVVVVGVVDYVGYLVESEAAAKVQTDWGTQRVAAAVEVEGVVEFDPESDLGLEGCLPLVRRQTDREREEVPVLLLEAIAPRVLVVGPHPYSHWVVEQLQELVHLPRVLLVQQSP